MRKRKQTMNCEPSSASAGTEHPLEICTSPSVQVRLVLDFVLLHSSKFSCLSPAAICFAPSLLPPRGSQLPQHLGQSRPGRPGGKGALQYPLWNDRPAVQTREWAECCHPVRQPNQNAAGQRGPYTFNMFQSFDHVNIVMELLQS